MIVSLDKILNLLNRFYLLYFVKYFYGGIKYHNRHKNYEDYIKKQLEKTLDPKKIYKWKNTEWDKKVNGFEKIFDRNKKYLQNKKKGICLGSRTGQEVFVLQKLGLDTIGIDLVEFPPYTVKGDIHDLQFKDKEFDLIFTNIIDHSLYLNKFISEMERIATKGAHIIINLEVNVVADDYSENFLTDPKKIIEMFHNSSLIKNRKIKNTFDKMNVEIVFEKNN